MSALSAMLEYLRHLEGRTGRSRKRGRDRDSREPVRHSKCVCIQSTEDETSSTSVDKKNEPEQSSNMEISR